MLDALRNHDAPPLRPDLLAAGDAIAAPRRRRAMPDYRLAFLLVVAATIVVLVMVML